MADADFGCTAWGRDWVRLAQPLLQTRPEPLLPRARKLVLSGAVEITVDGRTVRGVVQHGRNAPVVSLEIAPMSREARAEVSGRLSGARPVLSDELHRAITVAGCPLAPVLTGVGCSCSAGTGRCIHVLAVYYEMARRVDDDPRITLELQGFFRTSGDSGGGSPPL